jgi:hypothetical protein
MVNYYRDMWPLRSHLLAPLSSLTSSKVKWKWTTDHQESFDKMKALIAKETLCRAVHIQTIRSHVKVQTNTDHTLYAQPRIKYDSTSHTRLKGFLGSP